MKTKTIAVNSVELEIAGTKLTLTLEQVAELKKMLAKAFPEPEIKVVFTPGPERIVERYRQMPPMFLESPPKPLWREYETTCSASSHPSSPWVSRIKALDCASTISH